MTPSNPSAASITGPGVAPVKILRVPCPYCREGGVNIAVSAKGLDDQVQQLQDPRQCDRLTCRKFFRTVVQVVVTGKKIDSTEN